MSERTTLAKAPAKGPLPRRVSFQRATEYVEGEGPMRSVVPPIVREVLRSPGTPLDVQTRAVMEPRFEHDFSAVRVHTGSQASASADAVNALAYTVGRDVVFGSGQYTPETSTGQKLIAHELTHVVQQSGVSVSGDTPAALAEAEAGHNADSVLAGQPNAVVSATGCRRLHRAPKDEDKAIDSILDAAAKARSAKTKTETMIHAAHVINAMIARYLPTYGARVSGVVFDAAVKRLSTKTSKSGKDIEITVGKEFINDIVDARKLRPLAGELERALAGTGIAPLPEAEPELSSVAAADTPARGVRTEGIKFERDDLRKVTEQSYWEAKVGKVYFMIEISSTGARLHADPEERDAVFSVLWQVRPKKVTRTVTKIVTILPRGKGAGGKPATPVLYKFTFKPAAKDTAGMPSVEYEFVAEGAATTVTAAPDPDKSYKPSKHDLHFSGFPAKDIDAYWTSNPGEHRQLYNWIENLAPASFDQVITTSTGKPAKTTTFKVKGTKSKSGISGLTIDYLGKIAPQTEAVPADYRSKTDAGDLALEEQQNKHKDKLGSVKVPRDVSAAEAAEVKYLIAAYFKKGTRNVEVDVRVPALDTGGEIFYTFRFLPNNDVEAIRVGEPKKGTRLDLTRLDAGRSPEFLRLYKAKDVKALAAFLAKRYPGLAINSQTVEELRVAINKEINTKAHDVAWFKSIYGLTILDSTTAEERLRKKHDYKSQQTAGLKDFEPGELSMLEATLETFSITFLSRLKGTYLARQDISIEKVGKALASVKKRSGITLTKGTDTTIIIFDQAAIGDETLFVGGRLGVLPTTSLTFAHEFGHAIGDQAAIQMEFNKFVANKKIKPITSYAGSAAEKEFFPEAFALFNTDPEWMKANQPELYEWFAEFAKTGKPPVP